MLRLRFFSVAVGVVAAAAADNGLWQCWDHSDCFMCASSSSWTSGYTARCRWCPYDNSCHEFGSLMNPCSTADCISDPNSCPAEPDPPGRYNVTDALEMLTFASIGYCSPDAVMDWRFSEESCMSRTAGFEIDAAVQSLRTGAFGYVGHDDAKKHIVVAFKGTNGTDDLWDIDLLVSLNRTKNYDHRCRLTALQVPEELWVVTHLGFCEYYHSLNGNNENFDFLEHEIENVHAAHPDYSVWFTGHSLGGAVAALQAVTFAVSTGVAPHLLTFGQPRTGDVTFSSLVDRVVQPGVTRITHGRDLVVHLSPCCGDGATCTREATCPLHSAREVWYPDHMAPIDTARHRVCEGGDSEDPACSLGLYLHFSVQDHYYYFGQRVGSMCCSGKASFSPQRSVPPAMGSEVIRAAFSPQRSVPPVTGSEVVKASFSPQQSVPPATGSEVVV